MEPIIGPEVRFEIESLSKIGDLVYYDGPLLSVFSDRQNNPYIYRWVEVDDQFNRWLVFKTSVRKLNRYVHKRISEYDLILEPEDGYLYVVDLDKNTNPSSIRILSLENVPSNYLPHPKVYHDDEESMHLEAIKRYFSLNQRVSLIENEEISLLKVAQKYHSEVLDLHITNGVGVGYGEIALSVFAPVIDKVHKLQSAFASSPLTVMAFRRASFSVILKPTINEEPLPGFISSFENSTSILFALIERSIQIEDLQGIVNDIHPDAIKAYVEILRLLKKTRIDLNIDWANPISQTFKSVNLAANDNNLRLKNVLKLTNTEMESFVLRGRFTKVDVMNNDYRFAATNGVVSTGKLAEIIESDMKLTITFNKYYEVEIDREITVSAAQVNPKKIDSIIRIVETEPPRF